MLITEALLADSSSGDQDSAKQLVYSVVAVLIFVPIFLSMRRKVKSGDLAPNDRRTSPHSRTYLVIIASLNVVIAAAFLVGGVLGVVTGDIALGVGLLLLSGLISTFSWMIFRQGRTLRREGLPDRAPSDAQKKLSKPRRTTAYALGAAAGIATFGTISAAYDREWTTALVGAVIAALAYGASWWLYRPLRRAKTS
jgi:hypothetical protein